MNKNILLIGSALFIVLFLFGCASHEVWLTGDEEPFEGQGVIKLINKGEERWSLSQDAICDKIDFPYIAFIKDINGESYPFLIEAGNDFEEYFEKNINVKGKLIYKAATLCDDLGNCIAPACQLLVIEEVNLVEG